ncbi:hypothetical protein AA0488_2170 [Kozakia baliensis NRIC 0488]|nr:hypothetical protein AA0488_2170 [Kozakia baliensis NRIC 0488]GEL62945.1 hypothetical protein KBA01_02310 [Kozakia baliensis]
MVLAGIGVSILPDFLLDKPEIASQIVRIAPRWHAVLGSIYAYTPPIRPDPTAHVTAFIEWLQCAVKKQPFPVETK